MNRELGNIEIGLTRIESNIDATPAPIEIEITGLKSIGKFIGLEDTPLYYDNGKFFKVENNKIVYTDITWADIQGSIKDNPDLQKQITDAIEDFSKEYVDNTVKESVEQHNEDVNAHPSIQQDILDNYTDLSNQISSNYIEFTNTVTEIQTTLNNNTEDISTLFDEVGNVVQELSDLTTEVTLNTENIEVLDTSLNLVKQDVTTNTSNIEQINQSLLEYVKSVDLGKVAYSDDYNDLINLPDIPSIDGLATIDYVDQKINDAIGEVTQFKFKKVDELPETGMAGIIYLVPHVHGEKDIYDEYIWIEEDNSFELIGNTDIDLSGYYTKDETNTLLNEKQNVLTAGDGIEINDNTISGSRIIFRNWSV